MARINLGNLIQTTAEVYGASQAGRLAGEQQLYERQMDAIPHLMQLFQVGTQSEVDQRRGELESLRQLALLPGQTPESQQANAQRYADLLTRQAGQPRQYGPGAMAGILGAMSGPLGKVARQVPLPGVRPGAPSPLPSRMPGVASPLAEYPPRAAGGAQTPMGAVHTPTAPKLQFRNPADQAQYEETIAALLPRLKTGTEFEQDPEARLRYVRTLRTLHQGQTSGRPFAEVVQELGGDPLAALRAPTVDRKRATVLLTNAEAWKKKLSVALASPDLDPDTRQSIETLLSGLPATIEGPEDLKAVESFLQQAPSLASYGETKARDSQQILLLNRAKALEARVDAALKGGNVKQALEAIQSLRKFAGENPELPGVQPFGGDAFDTTPQAVRRRVRVPTAGMEQLPGELGAYGKFAAAAMPFVEYETDGTETPEEIQARQLEAAAEFAEKPADKLKLYREGFTMARQVMTSARWDQMSEPEQSAMLERLHTYADKLGIPSPLPANFRAGRLTPYQQEQIKQREADRELRKQSAEEAQRRFNATQTRLRAAATGKLDAGSKEWVGQLTRQTANRWREYQSFVKSPDNSVFLGGFDPATDPATNPTQERAKALFDSYRAQEADAAEFVKQLPTATAAPKTGGGEARKTISIGGRSATVTFRELVEALSRSPLYKDRAREKATALWRAK